MEPVEDFYSRLPKRYVGAGVLITDESGRVLLVEPAYKSTWEIPGGVVETSESAPAAARRECQEELGITVEVGRLLLLEHQTVEGRGDSIMFVYDGGVLAADMTFTLPAGELRSHRFVAPADLDGLTVSRLANRIRAAIEARENGTMGELVDGAASTQMTTSTTRETRHS